MKNEFIQEHHLTKTKFCERGHSQMSKNQMYKSACNQEVLWEILESSADLFSNSKTWLKKSLEKVQRGKCFWWCMKVRWKNAESLDECENSSRLLLFPLHSWPVIKTRYSWNASLPWWFNIWIWVVNSQFDAKWSNLYMVRFYSSKYVYHLPRNLLWSIGRVEQISGQMANIPSFFVLFEAKFAKCKILGQIWPTPGLCGTLSGEGHSPKKRYMGFGARTWI